MSPCYIQAEKSTGLLALTAEAAFNLSNPRVLTQDKHTPG